MLKTLTLLASIAATPVWTRTIHSVIVFNRHGDRTSKFYPNYQMTSLGAQQCFDSGSYYRDLYLSSSSPSQISGISPTDANFSQLWASAPDQPVLFQTAVNFMQGLYPPFANESTAEGYQYVHIQGEEDNSPDTIWLKGDDECPIYENASKSYRKSEEYLRTLEATRGFYEQFDDSLGTILGGPQNVTYKNAYNIFDLLNTASAQNSSFSIDPELLNQTRYLANEWEWNHNFNASQPDRSIGGEALAGGILRQMKSIVEGNAEVKFSLMTGSYDTFMAFFGLVGLREGDWMGLPNYAASMAFEMFSEADDAQFLESELRVRFGFRNGTGDGVELTTFPMFGQESLGYGEFVDRLGEKAIVSVGEWCERCQAEAEFCLAERQGSGSAEGDDDEEEGGDDDDGLSLAGAGGIGAGVTLAVVAIAGLIAWMILRKRKSSARPVIGSKVLSDAGSGSEKESV